MLFTKSSGSEQKTEPMRLGLAHYCDDVFVVGDMVEADSLTGELDACPPDESILRPFSEPGMNFLANMEQC